MLVPRMLVLAVAAPVGAADTVGVGLELVEDVQPATEIMMVTPINNNNAFLTGTLTYRFAIFVIGFILGPFLPLIQNSNQNGTLKCGIEY